MIMEFDVAEFYGFFNRKSLTNYYSLKLVSLLRLAEDYGDDGDDKMITHVRGVSFPLVWRGSRWLGFEFSAGPKP